MRARFRACRAWLLLGLLAAWPGTALAQETWAKVVKVYDADTLGVEMAGRREKVRLLGVDAPETGHSQKLERAAAQKGRSAQAEAALGGQARAWLAEQTPPGTRLRLARDSQAPERDQHGRLLAYVYLADGRQLNELLLSQGMARAFRRCGCAAQGRFLELERQARSQGRGLWGQGGP